VSCQRIYYVTFGALTRALFLLIDPFYIRRGPLPAMLVGILGN
jgi:hypothetical protein